MDDSLGRVRGISSGIAELPISQESVKLANYVPHFRLIEVCLTDHLGQAHPFIRTIIHRTPLLQLLEPFAKVFSRRFLCLCGEQKRVILTAETQSTQRDVHFASGSLVNQLT